MDDAVRVGEGHGFADAGERVDEAAEAPSRGALGEAGGARRGVDLVDRRAQRLATDQGHGEPEPPVGELAAIVDGDDPRVPELRGDGRLVEEAGAHRGPAGVLEAQHLHGEGAVEQRVMDAAHVARRAGGEEAEVAVARGERGARGGSALPVAGDGGDGPVGAVGGLAHGRAISRGRALRAGQARKLVGIAKLGLAYLNASWIVLWLRAIRGM